MNGDQPALDALAAAAIDEILAANAIVYRQPGDFTMAEFAKRAGWTYSHAQHFLTGQVDAGELEREKRYDESTNRHVWAYWKADADG